MRGPFVLAMATLIAGLLPGSVLSQDAPPLDPLQVLADGVLIDARCHNAAIDFGALTKYGEAHGLPVADILPLGSKRELFMATYKQRSGSLTLQALCSIVVAQEQDAAPGLVRSP